MGRVCRHCSSVSAKRAVNKTGENDKALSYTSKLPEDLRNEKLYSHGTEDRRIAWQQWWMQKCQILCVFIDDPEFCISVEKE